MIPQSNPDASKPLSLVDKLQIAWANRSQIVEGFANYYFSHDKELIAEAQRRLQICQSNVCGYFDSDGTSGQVVVAGEPGCKICHCVAMVKVCNPSVACSLIMLDPPQEPLWGVIITHEQNEEIRMALEAKRAKQPDKDGD